MLKRFTFRVPYVGTFAIIPRLFVVGDTPAYRRGWKVVRVGDRHSTHVCYLPGRKVSV